MFQTTKQLLANSVAVAFLIFREFTVIDVDFQLLNWSIILPCSHTQTKYKMITMGSNKNQLQWSRAAHILER